MKTSSQREKIHTKREWFKLPAEMKKAIGDYCVANNTNKSQFIRESIAMRLNAK